MRKARVAALDVLAKSAEAYKCRLYPNVEQAALISKTFGCCRRVYNLALELKKAAWEVENLG